MKSNKNSRKGIVVLFCIGLLYLIGFYFLYKHEYSIVVENIDSVFDSVIWEDMDTRLKKSGQPVSFYNNIETDTDTTLYHSEYHSDELITQTVDSVIVAKKKENYSSLTDKEKRNHIIP